MTDNTSRNSRRDVLAGAIAGVTVIGLGRPVQAAWPDRPVKMIVPTQPGGGIDSTARLFQRYFDDKNSLGQNLVVVNMDGAGGTIATRTIKDSPADGYTLGLWHDGLVTSNAMGVVDYDHGAFEILGSTGYETLGFGVGKDSKIKSIDDLVAMGKAQPGSIKCATNVGLPVHFYPLMFQALVGAEYRYVQSGGGAKRMPSVVGGHTDFAIFGTLEFVKFAEAGLRPIVMFGAERSPVLPDVPTGKEKGIDLIAYSYHIWLAPKDTPKEVTGKLTDLLRSAMAEPEIKKYLEENGRDPVFVEPAEVMANLDKMRERALPLVAKARQLQG